MVDEFDPPVPCSYFQGNAGGEPRAQMVLGEDTFVREALHAERNNCFEVGNGDKLWLLQGESEDDVRRWKAAILHETKASSALVALAMRRSVHLARNLSLSQEAGVRSKEGA